MDHEKNTKEITPKGNNQIGENPKKENMPQWQGPTRKVPKSYEGVRGLFNSCQECKITSVNGGGTSPLQQGGGGEKRTTPARGASCS